MVNSSQGHKPRVQADLFYDQTEASPQSQKIGEEPKAISTAAAAVSHTAGRDVRFSSPLENIPSNGTASRDYRSRPSLKTRLNEDRSHAQPIVPIAVQSVNIVNALEIVVQPVGRFEIIDIMKR
jgi:hypothetical protein